MIRTIICRFNTKKALDEFNAKLGLNLSPMTKDYDFSTFEEKKRQKPPKVFEYSQDYLDKIKIWQSNSMPYYNSFDEEIYATVNFHFDTDKYSSDDLAFLFDQPISDKTKSIRMPRLIHGRTSSWRVVGDSVKTYGDLAFKVKGEKHSISKVKTIAPVNVERIEKITEFVEYSCTGNRLNQGLDYLKEQGLPLDPTSTGDFIRWVMNDILKEESDVLLENGLTWKNVQGMLAKKAQSFYKEKIF